MEDLALTISDVSGRVRPKLTKSIVLIGMMGSGKSHVGSLLAKALGLPHRDSDTLIEREERRKIADIFSTEGEAAFRVLERRMIERLLGEDLSVISTGGGCLIVPETLQAIAKNGISVWLNAPVDVLFERIKNSRNRPLMDAENPRQRLEDLLEERKNLYAQADLVVEDPLAGIEALVLKVLITLEGYLDR